MDKVKYIRLKYQKEIFENKMRELKITLIIDYTYISEEGETSLTEIFIKFFYSKWKIYKFKCNVD